MKMAGKGLYQYKMITESYLWRIVIFLLLRKIFEKLAHFPYIVSYKIGTPLLADITCLKMGMHI